jgi:hypothetical protein
MKKNRIPPALCLFLLAPACGELLSGSSPPAEFFNPITFIMLSALYGGGALLIRELMLRWEKGWPSMLILGAAYGIIEEGLMVQSFFNPFWVDLGNLASYGRWFSVNWIWTVELTIFHTVVSIAIPITLTHLLYPDQKERIWLSKRWFNVVLVLFCLVVSIGLILFGAFNPEYPLPLLHLIVAALLVVVLILIARKIGTGNVKDDVAPAKKSTFFIAGFTGIFLLFFFSWFLPEIDTPVILTFLLLLFLPALMVFWIHHLSHGSLLPPRHQLALIAGVIFLMAILDQILMLDPNPPDNRTGMWLVGLCFVGFLIWLDRRLVSSQNKFIGAGE